MVQPANFEYDIDAERAQEAGEEEADRRNDFVTAYLMDGAKAIERLVVDELPIVESVITASRFYDRIPTAQEVEEIEEKLQRVLEDWLCVQLTQSEAYSVLKAVFGDDGDFVEKETVESGRERLKQRFPAMYAVRKAIEAMPEADVEDLPF